MTCALCQSKNRQQEINQILSFTSDLINLINKLIFLFFLLLLR